ncbi:unnamed protein product [Caenorhabditis brenneri]
MLWENPGEPCDFIKIGTYNVSVTDGLMLIESVQTAFQLDKHFEPANTGEPSQATTTPLPTTHSTPQARFSPSPNSILRTSPTTSPTTKSTRDPILEKEQRRSTKT